MREHGRVTAFPAGQAARLRRVWRYCHCLADARADSGTHHDIRRHAVTGPRRDDSGGGVRHPFRFGHTDRRPHRR